MYALVDCNNFYASCERVFNPNLMGKPVAILSNNDGCVIARSDEAKLLKLPMGAPIYKYEYFCKMNNIHVLSSNYSLYGDMSHRVMSILKQFTPDVEVYSIDESFLELKGFEDYNLQDYGTKIRSRVLKWTGIPTSVGIAPTKGLSKIANKIARKSKSGVCIMDTNEKCIKALKWIAIEDVWGIGSRLAKRLRLKGCETAFDFTQIPENIIKKEFSVIEARLHRDLNGIETLTLDDNHQDKKTIATTRSFNGTLTDPSEIKERVSTFASFCAQKLRKQKSNCHSIIVMLRSNKFDKNGKQHSESRVINLSTPTSSSLIISKVAVTVVAQMIKKGVAYKKAGVIVTGIVPSDNYQFNLFEQDNSKHIPLMDCIDHLNKKYGTFKIKLGNQDLQRTWKMKQDRLSPKYTTNINDIIVVK
jgi:DNA polymerase V